MNRHMFAPGAIEHHKRVLGTPAQRRELVRWVRLAVLCIVCTGGLAFGAGLFVGWLP
jgi:hypothetical protein